MAWTMWGLRPPATISRAICAKAVGEKAIEFAAPNCMQESSSLPATQNRSGAGYDQAALSNRDFRSLAPPWQASSPKKNPHWSYCRAMLSMVQTEPLFCPVTKSLHQLAAK